MALFKISKGSKANLPTTLTEGFCWYTYDDSKFYIDYKDENDVLVRKALNAKDAETLMGASLATVLSSSDVEIPTSKAVLDAINDVASDLAAHTHSWNDLEDKPFYGDVIESIVWDGDANGKDIVTVSYDTRMRYVKVSERYFEQQDLIGGKFTLYVTDSNREASLDIIDDLVDSAAGYGFADSASWCVTDGSEPNVFVIHSEEYFEDWGLFTPGVYVLAKYLEFDPNIVSVYVSEIEFPFDGKTISERYIPDTIARKSDVAAANHTHDILETSTIWTNELFVGDVGIEQLIENVIQRMMDAGRIIEN